MSEGWKSLNQIGQKPNVEIGELDINIRECFSSPSGKIVLDWLINITLDKSSVTHNPHGGIDPLMMAFREGENNIVRTIKNKMKVKKS